MDAEVAKIYGQKVRVRICGLCWHAGALLLVNHKGLTQSNFWAPPGGGLEFGESIETCLTKEFYEEAGLQVKVGEFRFACEFIQPPLHAIELFFDVTMIGGEIRVGADPEIQIINDVRFMTANDIHARPPEELHGIFSQIDDIAELAELRGFFRI
jgi:8-oxo-dGTP diphosphatase